MKIELEIPFNPQEISLLNMHSVMNVLNVVQYELLNCADLIDNPKEIMDLIAGVGSVAVDLSHPEKAIQHIRSIGDFHVLVEKNMKQMIDEYPDFQEELTESWKNIDGIFTVIHVRAGEIIERVENPSLWKAHNAEKLKYNFEQVLHAIEVNSHGAYRIVYNIAQHQDKDYLVHLNFEPFEGENIFMPPVLQDVMRDLIANARKYTTPGGNIDAGLFQSKDELRFVVTDTGRGIPQSEIEQVVMFGIRGSNVLDRPTRGGGFGLTKAYYVTQSYGGNLYIESPISNGMGTRVELRIPLPEDLVVN